MSDNDGKSPGKGPEEQGNPPDERAKQSLPRRKAGERINRELRRVAEDAIVEIAKRLRKP